MNIKYLKRGRKMSHMAVSHAQWPEKADPNRTRFTAGGDKINYPGKAATPTADMLVAKILFNSVISTP
jgi:hypothetical protein